MDWETEKARAKAQIESMRTEILASQSQEGDESLRGFAQIVVLLEESLKEIEAGFPADAHEEMKAKLQAEFDPLLKEFRELFDSARIESKK